MLKTSVAYLVKTEKMKNPPFDWILYGVLPKYGIDRSSLYAFRINRAKYSKYIAPEM